jgi:hypothetical protein
MSWATGRSYWCVFQDIAEPEGKRLRVHLSAIISFQHFRSRIAKVNEMAVQDEVEAAQEIRELSDDLRESEEQLQQAHAARVCMEEVHCLFLSCLWLLGC